MNPRISIIVDNCASEGLVEEHGFAAWVEVDEKSILFDTGQGGALLPNAERLGIDISQADMLVLSHGHWDHTGALAQVLDSMGEVPVYYHPDVFLKRYSVKEGAEARDISMAVEASSALSSLSEGRLRPVGLAEKIFPAVGLTGEVPRESRFEDTGGPFYLDRQRKQPDLIKDDLSLWIETDDGLVILTGCCHSGLVNTVEHIRQVSGIDRVSAIIGGLHLVNADNHRLEETCRFLKALEPGLIVPCHCTGKDAVAHMVQELGDVVHEGNAGFRWPLC